MHAMRDLTEMREEFVARRRQHDGGKDARDADAADE
jgi:hypothetical protein